MVDASFDGVPTEAENDGTGTLRYLIVAMPCPSRPVIVPPEGFGIVVFPAIDAVDVIQYDDVGE